MGGGLQGWIDPLECPSAETDRCGMFPILRVPRRAPMGELRRG